MSDCKDCVFYKPPADGYSCGKCIFPIPGWLKFSGAGGFVQGWEARECDMFKTPKDVAKESTKAE